MTEITQGRLCWPAGWPRTEQPRMAHFMTALPAAVDSIGYEVGRIGGSDLVISCDGQRGKRGDLLSEQPSWIDQGVAVYFVVKGDQRVLPCDRWNRLRDNLQAIAKTLEALRGIERWGTKQIVDAAFEGFKALPAPEPIEPERPWWEVLGVAESADPVVIDAAYRALAKRVHPDRPGGDAAAFRAITTAYEAARQVVTEER